MSTRTWIKGGRVVTAAGTSDGEFDGDLMIEGDRIGYVGPALDLADFDGRVLDATDKIVMPGMVDTHRHTWQAPLRFAGADWTIAQYGAAMWRDFGPQYSAQDTRTALRLGLAEALDAGITQVFDWHHGISTPEHADASVDAHRESRARTILGYGQSAAVWNEMSLREDHKSASPPSPDLERLCRDYFTGSDTRTMVAMAARGPEIATLDATLAEWRQADELGLRISVHVGNGLWSGVQPVRQLHDAGLLHERITFLHCNSTTDAELELIRACGATVSCSVEEELHMGHGRPAVTRLLDLGMTPSLSVDTCSNVSGSIFPIMRAALAVARGDHNQRLLDGGLDPSSVRVTALDAIGFATLAGARANGLDQITGSLEAGKQADVVLIDTNSPGMFPLNYAAGAVVMNGHPALVDTVLVAGEVVKHEGRLVGVDLTSLRHNAEELRDRLYRTAGAQRGGWSPPLRGRRLSQLNHAS